MDIYDADRRKWYEIKRGRFGRLTLREIQFKHIIRLPAEGDLVVYSTKLKLEPFIGLPEPTTPQ